MKNKIALVVGAGDNLGSAICKCFSNEGFIVVAARRNGDKLVTLQKEIETSGGVFYGYSLDARKENDVIEFIKNIEKHINKTTKTIKKFFKNSFLKSLSAADDEDVDTKNSLYVTIVDKKFKKGKKMIEPLLCGIVLGLVPITLLGLFVSAWNQYRRGSGILDID